jgi:hypothetical protein
MSTVRAWLTENGDALEPLVSFALHHAGEYEMERRLSAKRFASWRSTNSGGCATSTPETVAAGRFSSRCACRGLSGSMSLSRALRSMVRLPGLASPHRNASFKPKRQRARRAL